MEDLDTFRNTTNLYNQDLGMESGKRNALAFYS